jgi:CHAT domain-containing protein
MKKIASELSRIRKLLSDLGFEGPTRGSTDGLNETVSVLVEEKDRKEAELAGLPSMEKMIDPITKREVERIGSLLPNGSVLIDFAKFRLYDFKEEKYLSSHYLAFLLRARTKKVDLIDLGDAEEIDDLIAELRKPLNLGVQGTGNDQHGVAPDFEKLVKKRGNTLYKRIFSPLVSKIKGATDIFVSPDGELNLIPFEVLVDDNDDYLIDCYTFTYVSTPREITTFGRRCDENSPPLLMGDPDFDQILETKAFPSERGHPDDRPYTSLPVTREEVEEIARYLNTPHYYTGKQASMDVLFQASSPRILHLATHGFFDPNIAYKQGDFPIRNVDLAEEFSNPLHRSGIVLAGANTSSCGILTAEKILSLSLEGTEMVVLSACETGLGRIKRGEGVFGLRRSFALAGAKSVVMSMWKVPDKETKQLMSYFYQNLSSMNRAKALKEAALSLRKDLSVLHGHNHPFFWGAFIFAGDRG